MTDTIATIMLVEDDTTLIKMYSSKFEKNNYTVINAMSGEDALIHLKTKTPDIILLDIVLPDIPGLKVLEKIKKNKKTKNIPILILTVLPEIIALKKAIKLGAEGYLIKSENTPDTVLNYVKAELDKLKN